MADITNKLVINLSSTPLTDVQTSLLASGPKFAIVCKHPPKSDHVAAVEVASHQLPPYVAAELRSDASKLPDRTTPQT